MSSLSTNRPFASSLMLFFLCRSLKNSKNMSCQRSTRNSMILPQKGTTHVIVGGGVKINFVLPVALGRSFGPCGGGYWQHAEWSERLLRSWAQWVWPKKKPCEAEAKHTLYRPWHQNCMSAPVNPRISSTLLSMAMVIFLLGSQMLRLCCGVEIFRCPVKKELKRQFC